MLISGKGKYFCVFGCISKNFSENIFWCLEKKKENTNPKKHKPQPRKKSSTIAISIRRDLATARSRERSTLHEIAPSIAISIRRDLTKARSRSRERIVISRRQDRDQRRDLANDRDLAKARSRSTSRSRDSAISRSVDRGRQTGAREIGDPITSTYRTRRNPQSPTTIFICMNFFVIGCRE